MKQRDLNTTAKDKYPLGKSSSEFKLSELVIHTDSNSDGSSVHSTDWRCDKGCVESVYATKSNRDSER